MPEPYRPSNGSEGEGFIENFCAKCRHDSEDNPCQILSRSFAFQVTDPDYPIEWQRDADGSPTCTAFETDDGSMPRCDKTKDMFA